jgi:hypothetical protein
MRRAAAVLLLTIAACEGAVKSTTTEGGLGFPVESPEDRGVAHLSNEEVDAILLGEAAPPEYSSVPATSGTHAPLAAPCGIYREEIPEIFIIHTLEHGVVVVYYKSGEVDVATLAEVEELARTMSTHIVVAPYSIMPTPVAFVAWGHLAARPSLEVEEVRSFWGEYAQRGPESGVGCPVEVDQA